LPDNVEVLTFIHGGNCQRLGIAPAGFASPMMMSGVGSFMVPKPAATPCTSRLCRDVVTPAAVLGTLAKIMAAVLESERDASIPCVPEIRRAGWRG